MAYSSLLRRNFNCLLVFISSVCINSAFAQTPTVQGSNLNFTNVTTSSMTVNWTNGNGTNRIVVARAGATPDVNPSDLDTYTADAIYGTPGTELGNGFVVFNGTGNSVAIANLSPKIFYHFQVFEYNGAAGAELYNITSDANNPARKWAGKPFTTTWVTTDGQITIPTAGSGYNYDVVWTNLSTLGLGNGAVSGQLANYTINSLSFGDTYQVLISGDFPRINFNNGGDKDKILTVEEWGDIEWSNMQTAFYGCTNLRIPAIDAPDLSGTLSLNQMFRGASSFNESIDHWDVSNIILFFGMFQAATSYNQ
ncbi:MAG: hypothetical protein ACI9C9_000992, partial [Marivirga sp.]